MLCDIYPLRSQGKKLPEEEIRARGRRGWLELARRDDGAPVAIARAISERGSLMGELASACVTKITREGLLVSGWEMRPVRVRQAWWCVPVLSGAAAAE